jgi:CubicO group peptidase (beta-lactamase class C family)
LRDFAQRTLFGALGFSPQGWIGGRDGTPFGGTHLFLSPSQMFRIGQLCIKDGVWQGRRLIASGWIAEATRVQAGDDWWEGPYGWHFWVRPRGYAAYGYGGQVIFVAPETGLVCVLTAHPDSRRHIPIATTEAAIIHPLLDAVAAGRQTAVSTQSSSP